MQHTFEENEYEELDQDQEYYQDQEDQFDENQDDDIENYEQEDDQPNNNTNNQNPKLQKQKTNLTSSSNQSAPTQISTTKYSERERQKNLIREGLVNDPELESERKDLWKLFGMDSAAGKELFKLYKSHKQPAINYPRPKPMKKPLEKPNVQKSCPQKAKIEYPSLYKEREPQFHMIDFVPKRKREQDIRKEIELYYQGRKFFRPKIRGVDRKKLIEEFQAKLKYQRGALPKGAELPVINMIAPDTFASNEETKTQAIKKIHNKYLHFTGLKPDKKDDNSSQASMDPQIELKILFDQIVAEIEERQQFLEEIEKLDEPQLKQKIKDEIIERVSELQKVQELKQAYSIQ